MSAMDAVNSYYDAWRAGKGDFSAVPLAPMTAAEVLTVRDGLLVHGELIYDAQESGQPWRRAAEQLTRDAGRTIAGMRPVTCCRHLP